MKSETESEADRAPGAALPRLLIVEDSALDAELEIAALAEGGLETRWGRVETAPELLAWLTAERPDLIIADYNMPRFDGLTALRLVRERDADLPFILVSGTLGEERAVEALKSGATDYVLKGNLARLAPVVQRALREYAAVRGRGEAEAALRRSEERYRLTAQATSDAVWEANTRTDELWWNEGVGRLFGYTPDQVRYNAAWLTHVHPADAQRIKGLVDRLWAGKERDFAIEYRFQRRDGTYADVLDRGKVLDDEHGNPVRIIGAVTDISFQKRAEHEVRALNAALEQRVAERTARLERANKELQAFAYSVSHDLRAPLRAIDGFTQVLLDGCAARLLDEESLGYLQRVHAAAKRMGQLIEDLLSLSRVSFTELASEAVDVTALAQTVVAELREREPQRLAEVRIADSLSVRGDERLLWVAIENLLGNAWKFSAQQAQARIEVGVATEDGQRVFFVRDNGAGFDMAYAHDLFSAFRRLHTSEEFPGTGVGLATVERIIHRHGGRIWAEAAVGQGATFFFTLPGA